MRKRITSLLLTLVMLLSLVPAMGVTASAAEWTTVNSYEELQTAVKAKNEYIKLGRDIDTKDFHYSGGGLDIADWLTFEGQTCTLDLNGKTLSLLTKMGNMPTFMRVYEGSNLTIKDSQGGGQITGEFENTGAGDRYLIHVNKSSLTLEGGTFRATAKPYGTNVNVIDYLESNVTIKDGVTISQPEHYAYGGGGSGLKGHGYALCEQQREFNYGDEVSHVVIDGGIFDGWVRLIGYPDTNGSVQINGGTFKKGVQVLYVAKKNNSDPTVTVNGGTFEGNVYLQDWLWKESLYMPYRLNGGTFKRSAENGTYSPYGNGGNSWYTIANYGTMEINTGVTVENAGGYSSMIRNGGEATADCNLTIRGGNFTGGINTVKNDLFGVLTINGGNFSNTAQYVIMNWNKAEITAGTFRTLDTASAVLFTSAFGSNANYVGELTISGGEFKHASDTQEMIVDHYDESNKGNAVVTGGKFDADISKYIPTDYVQSADGTVEKLGETNAVAKVGGTYYKTLADAVAAAQDGDTITLLKDAELTSTLNLAKNITIDGQGKYTIKAANNFIVGKDNNTCCVLYVSGEVTLKDVTVNGNEKCRVIFCDKGKLTIDGATITNGKAPNFIGGVYMTSSASFEMKSGSITGNKNAELYQNEKYLQYSSDLWIGANANGALTAINGGTIGNVFVNANAWSASNPGSFTMNGGTVTNLYVEHDANYGATFKYNDGTIEHLYLSKENGNGQSIEVTPVKGVIYNGGVKEEDLVTLTLKYNDGATADTTYNVASGTTITLPTPRRSGYTFNGWYDGSTFYAAGASYTVSATVTLNASWSYISSGSSYDPTYSVSTPSKTEHGTVTVSPKSASKGDTVTVTVKPDSGYVLETLTVTDKNGNELTLKDKGNGKYTFTMPAGKVEVKATFMEDNSMLNFFYDVPNNAYFYEAVKWAVKNGITTGVGGGRFDPAATCTRAQIAAFLARSMK